MIVWIIITIMITILSFCFTYLIVYGNDYTFVDSNGISWYCQVGSDYTICNEIDTLRLSK